MYHPEAHHQLFVQMALQIGILVFIDTFEFAKYEIVIDILLFVNHFKQLHLLQ
jgi:hypothetical protein